MEVNPYEPPRTTEIASPYAPQLPRGRQVYRLAVLLCAASAAMLSQYFLFSARYDSEVGLVGMLTGLRAFVCGVWSSFMPNNGGISLAAVGLTLVFLHPMLMRA